MAALFGIEIKGVGELLRTMRDLPKELDQAERLTVLRASLEMQKRLTRAATGEVLKVRSGAYRRGVAAGRLPPARQPNGAWEARVGVADGPANAYAKMHETGGTIRPKGKLLAIPMGAALARSKRMGAASSGVPSSVSPRDYPDGFWLRRPGRTPIFVRPVGTMGKSGARLDLLFYGATSVTIPARRPLGRSFDEIRPQVPGYAEREVARAIERAQRGR